MGNLHKYVGVEETKSLIDYTDKIYLDFGATKELEGITHPGKISNIRKSAESAGLDLINIPIRHLGTDKAHDLYKKIEETLEEAGVKMLFNTEVTDILVENNSVQGVRYESNQKQEEAYSQTVIMAVGRVGAKWLLKMCDKHKIKTKPGTIDIGIRYELLDEVMEEINKYLYEGKFIGKPNPFNDKVRTFCQNPSGFVTTEVYDEGLTLVNGHSCKDIKSTKVIGKLIHPSGYHLIFLIR